MPATEKALSHWRVCQKIVDEAYLQQTGFGFVWDGSQCEALKQLLGKLEMLLKSQSKEASEANIQTSMGLLLQRRLEVPAIC